MRVPARSGSDGRAGPAAEAGTAATAGGPTGGRGADPTRDALGGLGDRQEERAVVARLLGREPRGRAEVVVRRASGEPVVVASPPLLDDGTPMPTMFWLVDPVLRRAVSRLEAAGGVREAEAAVDSAALEAAHARYAAARDAALPPGHTGPRPRGGVGGTRRGVKCLHAHLAWWLAGGEDPVGWFVADRLAQDPAAAEVLAALVAGRRDSAPGGIPAPAGDGAPAGGEGP